MKPATIRAGRIDDAAALRELHMTVAARSGGLARHADEIDDAYVHEFVVESLHGGLIFVAESDGQIVGDIHAWPYRVRRLDHVLSHLTIAVHPDAQGQGLGRRLFETLITEVLHNRPRITRIELISQESNARAIALYESLGFRREGRFEEGIKAAAGGTETDIPMGWLRSRARPS